MSLVQELVMEPEVNQRLLNAKGDIWLGEFGMKRNSGRCNKPKKLSKKYLEERKKQRAIEFSKKVDLNKWLFVNNMSHIAGHNTIMRYMPYLIDAGIFEKSEMANKHKRICKCYRRIK